MYVIALWSHYEKRKMNAKYVKINCDWEYSGLIGIKLFEDLKG
jgi:hypothetical protein